MKRRQIALFAIVLAVAIVAQSRPSTLVAVLIGSASTALVVVLVAALSRRGRPARVDVEKTGLECGRCQAPVGRYELVCSKCGTVARDGLLLGYAAVAMALIAGTILWRTGMLSITTSIGLILLILAAVMVLKLGDTRVGGRRES